MGQNIRRRIADIRRGNVPVGYKRTKLGIIPSDWNLRIMGELASQLTEQNGSSTDFPAYSINNQIGFIPQNLQFEEGSYDYLDKTSYRVVSRGQFAYNPARINVGSIGVLKDREKVIVSSLYVCFSVRQEVDSSFLEYWFNTPNFYREIIRNTEGSVREYLFYENFANIKIALPPLAEQRRIAGILGCFDRGIALKKELIAEKKRQKKALMQKLLNPDSGFRLPGFSGEWRKYSVSEICTIESGGTPATSNEECWGGNIFWCTPSDITNSGKYIYSTPQTITQKGIENSSATLLPIGSIIMCSRASIGPRCITRVPMTTNQGFKNFICSKSLYNEFWYYFIDTILEDLYKMASGNTFKEISKTAIATYRVVIPPSYKEQQAIADILSTADREIDLLEQELALQQQKKKSLMQLLLTGIVRV